MTCSPSSAASADLSGPSVRLRRPEDLPVLGPLLLEQQRVTGYPRRRPLPMSAEEFLGRPRDDIAWVAELDGSPVGHVSVTHLVDDDTGRAFSAASGRPLTAMGCISSFFVALGANGQGLGAALLGTAEQWCRDQGRLPVLDVFPTHERAYAMYRRRGWVETGRLRPAWITEADPDLHIMVLPDQE